MEHTTKPILDFMLEYIVNIIFIDNSFYRRKNC